jgi:type I restriction enzyme R subunit
VDHFEKRLDAMDGKAMVVCMSRRICVDLYNEIIRIRPSWHSDDDKEGFLKVVMTGSATDPVEWQQHIRDKRRRNDLATNFKTPESQFKMVIVRGPCGSPDSCPELHTIVPRTRPMKDHGLMQYHARVNRVFQRTAGGPHCGLIGLAEDLKKHGHHTRKQGQGRGLHRPARSPQGPREEIEVMQGPPPRPRLAVPPSHHIQGVAYSKLPSVIEHIPQQQMTERTADLC